MAISVQIPTYVEDQDKWLDEELKEANKHKCQHIVIFQHIPWFLKNPSEEDDVYFNIEKPTRQKMLERFKAAGIELITILYAVC